MATVTKPIALDESLNTTESPSRNIADVLAEELEGIKNAIGGGGGSGGHTIYDADEQAMPQRAGLGFTDAHVSDNSGDDRTDVSIIEGISKTDWDNLDPTDPSNNGLYEITDPNNTPILTASEVGYGTGTVADALDYAIDAQLNKAVVFSTTAVGGKYFAVLGRLPIEYPSMPTLLRVNVLGSGDAPLTDFTVAALDTSDYYIATTNSNYGGKAIFVSMSI